MPPVGQSNTRQVTSVLPSAVPVGVEGASEQVNLQSVANGLTAHAGGGQGSALPLTAKINRITVVASANDSVLLPASIPGTTLCVINAAAVNSMNIFPQTGDAINALSANTAFALAANKAVEFFCAVAGIWNTQLTA